MSFINEAYAAINITNPTSKLGEGQAGLNRLVEIAINTFFAFAGLLFLAMLFIAGINYINAGGDPKSAQAARDRIKNALIGLIIVVGAFAITQLILSALGLNSYVDIISSGGTTKPTPTPTR